MEKQEKVLIILGSHSDKSYGVKVHEILLQLGIDSSVRIASAHRSPDEAVEIVSKAQGRGVQVVVAVAGLAAHLPGVCAAHTALPVIGLPVATGPLNGVDAMHSIVMMPPGVPVAGVTVGQAGIKNAALLAARIVALGDDVVQQKLNAFREKQRQEVIAKDNALQLELKG